jgi:hypothetical protein
VECEDEGCGLLGVESWRHVKQEGTGLAVVVEELEVIAGGKRGAVGV